MPNPKQQLVWGEQLVRDIYLSQNRSSEAFLVAAIVNGKLKRIAQLIYLPPEDPNAQRVKSRDRGNVGVVSRRIFSFDIDCRVCHRAPAFASSRSFISLAALLVKVIPKIRPPGTPGFDQFSDPKGDHPSLTRPCSRQNKNWARESIDRFGLVGIQTAHAVKIETVL